MQKAQEISNDREKQAAAMDVEGDAEDKTPDRNNVLSSSRFQTTAGFSSGKKTAGLKKRTGPGAQGGPGKRAKAEESASASGISAAFAGAECANEADTHGVDVLAILEGQKLGREINGGSSRPQTLQLCPAAQRRLPNPNRPCPSPGSHRP